MSHRSDWPLALSVGPGSMNAAALDAMAAAGIRQVELSSGDVGPYYDELDFPHRAKELVALARDHGVTVSSLHLPFAPFLTMDPASPKPAVRRRVVEKQSELLRACGDVRHAAFFA